MGVSTLPHPKMLHAIEILGIQVDRRKLGLWTILTMLAISSLKMPRSTGVAMQQVNSRVVLVTGANKGIGFEIARDLKEHLWTTKQLEL
jgi:hypothetical protein